MTKDHVNPAFLYLWFSHPLVDQQSLAQVTLLGADGQPIAMDAGGMIGLNAQVTETAGDHLGWLTYTLSPENAPAAFTVRLLYTIGPWAELHQFDPNEQSSVALGSGSQFNSMGQNARGEAFFSISIDMKQDFSRQFGVVAVTRDGRALQPSGGGSSGGIGEAVHVQQFIFAAPLADIVRFQLSTRPIKTVEFPNVSTKAKPAESASQTPAFGPVTTGIGAAPSAAHHDVLLAELKAAKEVASSLEAQFKAGAISTEEVQTGRDRVAILEAELTGDPIRIAEVRLAAAKSQVEFRTRLYQAGIIPHGDLLKAQGDVSIAEASLEEAKAAGRKPETNNHPAQ
jgi:hypothetical protein